MDNTPFGFAMLIVGMGGTLLTLYLLTLMIRGLCAIFPPENGDDSQPKEG